MIALTVGTELALESTLYISLAGLLKRGWNSRLAELVVIDCSLLVVVVILAQVYICMRIKDYKY